MHPELCWMIYRTEAALRQQQLQQPQHHHWLAYPRLQERIACWSGRRLLQCAEWLLRYGQQPEQGTLGVRGAGRDAANWERTPRQLM